MYTFATCACKNHGHATLFNSTSLKYFWIEHNFIFPWLNDEMAIVVHLNVLIWIGECYNMGMDDMAPK